MATYRQVKKRFKEHDWFPDRQNGSHVIFKQKATGRTVPVPRHSGDLSKGVIDWLEKETGISFK